MGLQWTFKVKDDTNLRFTVDSCDDLKTIGMANIAPDDLIKGRSDPVGVKRVITYIESKQACMRTSLTQPNKLYR